MELFKTFSKTIEKDTEGNMPVGKPILAKFQSYFSSQGFRCGKIYQHSFYGWGFIVMVEYSEIEILLQYDNKWLIIMEERIPLFSRLFKKCIPQISKGQCVIDSFLEENPCFTGVSNWMTREEYTA